MTQEHLSRPFSSPATPERVAELEKLVDEKQGTINALQAVQKASDQELFDKVNRVTAVDGAWVMVGHVVNEAGKQRGWHYSDDIDDIRRIVEQLGSEMGTWRQCWDLYYPIESTWTESIDTPLEWDDIEDIQHDAAMLVKLLRNALKREPFPFTIRHEYDQGRLGRLLSLKLPDCYEPRKRLLACLLPVGLTSEVGFSPAFGYRVPDITSCCAGRH